MDETSINEDEMMSYVEENFIKRMKTFLLWKRKKMEIVSESRFECKNKGKFNGKLRIIRKKQEKGHDKKAPGQDAAT